LSEAGIEEPLGGWLLSQGTLRIVALLAVLRHPRPFSVVFIEELENGLDPRAIHLIVEEIHTFIEAGGQVVATTHSPYLLDLLDLSQIIVVERSPSGAPTFKRPSLRKLKAWSEKFAPGRLYTMGNLTES
jgi:predicted ATPase